MAPIRLRVTVRRMIVAVAVIAALVGSERTYVRWQLYRKRAAWYAENEVKNRATSEALVKAARELAAGVRPSLPGWGKFVPSRDLVGASVEAKAGWGRYLR